MTLRMVFAIENQLFITIKINVVNERKIFTNLRSKIVLVKYTIMTN